jgi:hypothetical protein
MCDIEKNQKEKEKKIFQVQQKTMLPEATCWMISQAFLWAQFYFFAYKIQTGL